MLRREVQSLAGGLPVLLWLLGLVGMLWADIPWAERFAGLGGFNKLLLIPFERSVSQLGQPADARAGAQSGDPGGSGAACESVWRSGARHA